MHIFAFLCLTFLFGCFCGIKFAAIKICLALFNICAVFVIKLLVFKTKRIENLYAFMMLFAFCCGAALGIYHDYKTFSKVYPLYGNDISVNGNVTETDVESFVVKTEYGNITVYNYSGVDVEKGDAVRLRGDFDGYKTAQYKGDFDNRLHNALYGNVGKLNCYYAEVTGRKEDFSFWDIGSFIRAKAENKIQSSDVSERCKGFVTALLTGNTEKLDENTKDMFRITGTSHVTAVSGLHVGIFLSFFILLSKGMRKNKIVHLLFMLTLVVMYVMLIGERASVFRAGIMTVASYVMFAARRRSDSIMNLMMAGVLICFVNPYYVTAPGFQMSFLATLGLVLFTEYFKHQVIAIPVISTLFMLLVTLYYYNTVSLTTVLANIIIVFLVPFVILTGYIGCFISPVLYVSFAISEFIMRIAGFFTSLEFLHFTLPTPDIIQFVMYFILICGAYLYFGKRKIIDFWIMMAFVCIIFLNGLFRGGEDMKSVPISFINGGNYNMEHIVTENGCEIFIDCISTADDYAIKNNIENIYAVVITDTSPDRRQGLEALCNTDRVRYVLLPQDLKEENLKLENCEVLYYNQDSYLFDIDGVGFEFTKINNERCLLVQIYSEIVSIPFDKTISELYGSSVICVPDKCTDSSEAVRRGAAEYYIHATYRYDYYDHGEKYITSQEGMITITFKKGFRPSVNRY